MYKTQFFKVGDFVKLITPENNNHTLGKIYEVLKINQEETSSSMGQGLYYKNDKGDIVFNYAIRFKLEQAQSMEVKDWM